MTLAGFNETMSQQILTIMHRIATDVKGPGADSYTAQHELINSMFRADGFDCSKAHLRLVVIDSLYSTNAGYSHFSFEEMAERLADLGDDADARKYFHAIVSGGNDVIKVPQRIYNQNRGLFNEPYGIQKNLKNGARQISLLSKYAYYVMLQDCAGYPLGFPIYDSLAKKMFPYVWRALGLRKCPAMSGDVSIESYVSSMNLLRRAIFDQSTGLFDGMQQFDILDAYLWRMGKFQGGNLSLLLDRNEYSMFVRNIGLEGYGSDKGSKSFDRMVRDALLSERDVFAGFAHDRRNYLESLRRHLLQITEQQS